MNVVPFPTQRVLTSARIAAVAARHGVRPDDIVVTCHIRAAIEQHGHEAGDGDDRDSLHGVDPDTGRYDAALLLDGWVRDEIRARAMAAEHGFMAPPESFGGLDALLPSADVLAFPPQPALRSSRIAEIAASHGLNPDDPIVLGNIQGAIDLHGRPRPGYDGDPETCWDVDPATGRLDAARLLDGWIREEVLARDIEGGPLANPGLDASGTR